eukprot:TRINITY_DN8820_c0_g1_i1.p1 TRINITY_DN8820_c0_g1~~TRINITY_DN8820_c0_g1_i1.p1  ORF type:complete len:110 (-),score=20.52 TRINITY_DN8820_c0_g1_i1:63-392(-)
MADIVQNEWQNKPWECYKDMGICLRGVCCCFPMIMMCDNGKALDRPSGTTILLALCCPFIAVGLNRAAAREKYGIEGSSGEDWGCAICCGGLANMQTAMEIKAREEVGM